MGTINTVEHGGKQDQLTLRLLGVSYLLASIPTISEILIIDS